MRQLSHQGIVKRMSIDILFTRLLKYDDLFVQPGYLIFKVLESPDLVYQLVGVIWDQYSGSLCDRVSHSFNIDTVSSILATSCTWSFLVATQLRASTLLTSSRQSFLSCRTLRVFHPCWLTRGDTVLGHECEQGTLQHNSRRVVTILLR